MRFAFARATFVARSQAYIDPRPELWDPAPPASAAQLAKLGAACQTQRKKVRAQVALDCSASRALSTARADGVSAHVACGQHLQRLQRVGAAAAEAARDCSGCTA